VFTPRSVIAVVVTVIWAVTYGLSIIRPQFRPPPEVSSVMLVIVTWTFATEARKRAKDPPRDG
jgi:16S rRNA A1518/A1519 N6-dimethyltransferase RsmA/KsgA/DIM1 with predicted DNA glycosylase/AP lyase activity